jgi:hypothetical protein
MDRPARIGVPWDKGFQRGALAESAFEWFVKRRGDRVIPTHAFNGIDERDRVPKLRAADPRHSVALPDLLIFPRPVSLRPPHFLEVKFKTDGPKARREGEPPDLGMNLEMHVDYLEIARWTGLAVHVVFVNVKDDEIRTATIAELEELKRVREDLNLVFYPNHELHLLRPKWSEIRAGYERAVRPVLRVLKGGDPS